MYATLRTKANYFYATLRTFTGMSNNNEGKVDGAWLLTGIKALGESQSSAALAMGKRRDYFQKHIKNETYFNAESLAEIARTFPRLNIRYVLTGEGSPTVTIDGPATVRHNP
jgi:hypothetical protein